MRTFFIFLFCFLMFFSGLLTGLEISDRFEGGDRGVCLNITSYEDGFICEPYVCDGVEGEKSK